jgi:hypothetical protein
MYLGHQAICELIITKALEGVKLTGAGGVGMMPSIFSPMAPLAATCRVVRSRVTVQFPHPVKELLGRFFGWRQNSGRRFGCLRPC